LKQRQGQPLTIISPLLVSLQHSRRKKGETCASAQKEEIATTVYLLPPPSGTIDCRDNYATMSH